MLKSTNSNYKYTFEARTVQLDNNLSLRLNKLNPSIPDLFFKCNHFQGTFFHCFSAKVLEESNSLCLSVYYSYLFKPGNMCIRGLCGQLHCARQRKEKNKRVDLWIYKPGVQLPFAGRIQVFLPLAVKLNIQFGP